MSFSDRVPRSDGPSKTEGTPGQPPSSAPSLSHTFTTRYAPTGEHRKRRRGITLRALLLAHTDDEVGAAREATDDDEIGFGVDRLPDGDILVTLLDTCDLSTVFGRCREIADAILDHGDDRITFTRDENKPACRLAALRAMRGRWRQRQAADGRDLHHSLDADEAKQEVLTAQRAHGRISALNLVAEHSAELLGCARMRNDDGDPQRFKVADLPNGEVIVSMLDTCDLRDVLSDCRFIIQELLEWDTERVRFTRDQTEADRLLNEYTEWRSQRGEKGEVPT